MFIRVLGRGRFVCSYGYCLYSYRCCSFVYRKVILFIVYIVRSIVYIFVFLFNCGWFSIRISVRCRDIW